MDKNYEFRVHIIKMLLHNTILKFFPNLLLLKKCTTKQSARHVIPYYYFKIYHFHNNAI